MIWAGRGSGFPGGRVALAVPLLLGLVASLEGLKSPINVYDEGLYLTLARFSGFHRLPYRDLWTLYGPGSSLFGPLVSLAFGHSILALRLLQVVFLLAMVAGAYELTRALAGWPLAAVVASAIGTVARPPIHFTLAFAFVLWGLALIHRDLNRPTGGRRLWVGFVLLGFSLLGRYEFAAVGAGLTLACWVALRRSVDRKQLLWAVAAGLGPPAAFILGLVVIVPFEVLYENLYHYPVTLYPDPQCRGAPTPWAASFRAVLVPLEGRVWDSQELVLILGNLLALPVGLLLLACSIRRSEGRPSAAVLGAVGLLGLFVFLQMRARAGSSPYPAATITLVGIAVLLARLRARLTLKARWIIPMAMLPIVLVMALWWVPSGLRSLSDWPEYDPVTGVFSCDRHYTFFCPEVVDALAEQVERATYPGEEIFVALVNNSGHFANAPSLYWVLDHPPASRFIEFNPCLTDRNDVQQEIVEDLGRVNVVVASTFYPGKPPLGVRATVLDDFLGREFLVASEHPLPFSPSGEGYRVLVRKESG
ncbi:MAG: hypothetical protein ACT4OM_05225 [Actinomycetota bacterium]